MRIVRVRLRKPRRVLTFSCDNSMVLNRDDICLVESDKGMEWGTCVLPPEPVPADAEDRYTMRLVRRANVNDIRTFESLLHEEKQARDVCLRRIAKHNLDMKLVDVEYTFDKRRIVFYFTAEERVDFRQLVRDLAHELRTRIELRHIQVRDEARMVGGIGSCGRELCCASWLNDFKPISMRMAKRQNLSLNPNKISGQCGRLLCCLGYENDQYEPLKKRKQREREERRRQEGEEEQRGEGETPAKEEPAPAPAAPPAPEPAAETAQTQESERSGGQKSKPRRRGKRRGKRRKGGGGKKN